ncbi:GNAT family N-acetyltransferase [Radiobacillus kanasensis]|uniref:GNAT family N-acetyltransferase n=1 Tax=Radiobacillus kanasensis TaxID=2844358 RepID=UPI001E51F69D|nr:GNAT family N-acetyltransferase [Radiobacillus kanasensis]UFU00731.1 GNAT family N-acetyltransferase [Radiobacillus kanasensis]
MRVYQATIHDLEGITPLFNNYRIFYKQVSDIEAAKAFLLDRFVHQDSVIFVAVDESNYVGFTQLYPTFSSVSMQKTFILNDLYVKQHIRGKGIGWELLAAAKDYAIQVGARGLTLETGNDNGRAQGLYEKFGYEHIVDTRFYYYGIKG